MVKTAHKAKEQSRVNAAALLAEINWLEQVVFNRLKAAEMDKPEPDTLVAPDLAQQDAVWAEFIRYYGFGMPERLVLILTLLPHIAPQQLGSWCARALPGGDAASLLGLITHNQFRGWLPTAETALMLLAGNNLAQRFRMQSLFDAGHPLRQHNILSLGAVPAGLPQYSGQLVLTEEYIDFFTTGTLRKPVFNMDFPAKRITTSMEWSNLVVDSHTAAQLQELQIWLRHGNQLMQDWGMHRRLKPGFKALFYGPPGTGKTATAALLGKAAGIEVYRIDLSMVISKYIGETEKNLEKVFARAEHKNWILFFDEADALFGKRTGISDAHDKYANQEIAYLLQRLEDYNGLVILASNMRGNVDEAFGRRLQSVVHFPMPRAAERLRLWQESFSKESVLEDAVDLHALAERYELAGGSINNVVQYASLQALHRAEQVIRLADLQEGIRKEYIKEGRTI